MLPRRRMSTVDTAWLRMDSEGNLMMIVGVALLRRHVSVAELKQALADRFLIHSRFRSRVDTDLSGSHWQEVAVDLDEHVCSAALPGTAPNKPALQKLVGALAQQPLDPARPLWQMHLVDNCIGEDGARRQALVVRIHHCIADGIALVGVFMSMFGETPGQQPPLRAKPKKIEQQEDNPWEQILLPMALAPVKAAELSAQMFFKSVGVVTEIEHLPEQLGGLGHAAGQLAADALKLATMSEDTPTRLKGQPKGKKHVAWSEPLPLDEIKVIGKFYGASVNDVLMSSVAGAFRAYLRQRGDQVALDTEVRVMVPVNLREPSKYHKLGNAFGLVPLVLPVGLEDPVARLHETQRRMNELKGSFTPLVAMGVLSVLGATPKPVQSEVQNYFARRATAVLSNVPGPRAPLYLGDSQLEQCMFWVPQSGDIGIGVSILSYNGGVQFGIVTDDAIVHDPEHIIARFAPEFEKLVLLALMAEWP
ncbi:wax ester/triacylglycerol synthase family O-acyltransferase [Massilia sp. TS11]|uniref:wax ester/triacylglycerol synthase family O-acyltransferase n=1 Tax=Massilia sp. TS11 TaxID=2908003 RepID=UPI001EDC0001|nr:wax ester/triacylglycerol synthase family O-acyltransferase [Massilia sp. TS11]MCG2586011.1 wax ester/triacylglycerol synthase family O-acyltransferase [Massilia sp. TS11]